jgi:ABC-type transport system substrate-binding protein
VFAAFGKGDFTLGFHGSRRPLLADLDDPGWEQLREGVGSQADELADRALKETDRTKRAKMYQDLQRMFMSGAPSAVPVGWVVTGVPAVGGYPAALNDGVTALA